MSEHYYGNVPAGWEPEVCSATLKDEPFPFVNPGFVHTCYEKPGHEGRHRCGHHHDSTHFNIQCRRTWESK